jgi:hypothetical protein
MVTVLPRGALVGELEEGAAGVPVAGDADADPSTAGAAPKRAGRKPVPDEFYAAQLQEYVQAAGGAIPSAREAARLLGIGQDRARRLVAALGAAKEAASGARSDTPSPSRAPYASP